jgi:hypothetical protein
MFSHSINQIKKAAEFAGGFGLNRIGIANYMLSIITWPKPEQLTCVAPSIKRAKS